MTDHNNDSIPHIRSEVRLMIPIYNANTFTGYSNNIALGKPTIQSSTHPHGLSLAAWKAVDGISSSAIMDGGCTHTREAVGSWWQVDLQGIYEIRQVAITSRNDAYGTVETYQLTMRR